jgi:hypothetical protein
MKIEKAFSVTFQRHKTYNVKIAEWLHQLFAGCKLISLIAIFVLDKPYVIIITGKAIGCRSYVINCSEQQGTTSCR